MSRPERDAIHEVLGRVPAAVASWSEGNAALAPLDIVEVRRPLRSLSSSGEGRWWAAPRDCRDDLAELTAGHAYNAVYAIWPSDGRVPLCGWGCSTGPTPVLGGAGFSSIPSDHWPSLAGDPDPEQGYVHEWLHQVEGTYRALGVGPDRLPSLHDAGAFTSCRPPSVAPFGRTYAEYHDAGARTWAPWYRDYMTGMLRSVRPLDTVTDEGPCLGLTPELWALRDAGGSRIG